MSGGIYGATSLARLDTCHKDLRKIFHVLIDMMDVSVIAGSRSESVQQAAFMSGRSKVQYPDSKHNVGPEAGRDLSDAADVIPYPIDWNDRERMTFMAGMVLAIADMLYTQGLIEHKIRWGGDWDKDTEVKDNGFDDLVHFELYKPTA